MEDKRVTTLMKYVRGEISFAEWIESGMGAGDAEQDDNSMQVDGYGEEGPVCAVSKGFQVFLHIAYRFLILNCCLDPFVYAWRIPKYRRAVRTVFKRCYRFRRRNAIDPDVTGISMYGTPGLQTTNATETYQT